MSISGTPNSPSPIKNMTDIAYLDETPKSHAIRIMIKQGSGVGLVYLEGHDVRTLSKDKIITIQNQKTKEVFSFEVDQLVKKLAAYSKNQYDLLGEKTEEDSQILQEKLREKITELKQNGPVSEIDISEIYLNIFFPTPSISLTIKFPDQKTETTKIIRHFTSNTENDKVVAIQNTKTNKIIKFDLELLASQLCDVYVKKLPPSQVPADGILEAIKMYFNNCALQLQEENIVRNREAEPIQTPLLDSDIGALFNMATKKFHIIGDKTTQKS